MHAVLRKHVFSGNLNIFLELVVVSESLLNNSIHVDKPIILTQSIKNISLLMCFLFHYLPDRLVSALRIHPL